MTTDNVCWCSHHLQRHENTGHRRCAVPGCGCIHYRPRIVTHAPTH